MSSPDARSRSDEFEIGWSSPDLASAVHAEPSHLPVERGHPGKLLDEDEGDSFT
jgi:hypothetical protein